MTQKVITKIWLEEPTQESVFVAKSAFCHGFNVYDDMLGNCSWSQMLWLLLKGEPPSEKQNQIFNDIAMLVANPGPRDPSIHAAMCAGTGGSTNASALMSALAVGAGQKGGAREVFYLHKVWNSFNADIEQLISLVQPSKGPATIWPEFDELIGFDASAVSSPLLLKALTHFAKYTELPHTFWLNFNIEHLEEKLNAKANMQLLFSAISCDLGFNAEQAEMLYLMLRLPGAAAHALEQKELGPKHFPFFELDLQNDPEKKANNV